VSKLLCILCLALLGCAAAPEVRPRLDWKDPASLPPVDRVVILHLDGETVERSDVRGGAATFPIRPYGRVSVIKESRELRAGAAEAIAEGWRHLVFDDRKQYLCHHPIVGLRFFARDTLLFETSVCWVCQTFFDTGTQWRGFDAKSASSAAFYEHLQAAMPSLPPMTLSP
jgi:hypothetical protein